jgi:hypothetical protein
MVAILLAVLSMSAAPQFEARPLKGPPVAGAIVELDGKHLTLETAAGRVALPTAAVMGVCAKQKPAAAAEAAGAWIDLADGSSLMARQYSVHDGRAHIALSGSDCLELPVRDIASVRFQGASGAAAGEWSRLLKMKTASDMLVVNGGETLDYHKGALRDVTDKVVQFELDGEVAAVKRPRVFGLICHATDEEPAEPLCWITDAAGSRWAVRAMSLSGSLRWTTVGGASVSRPLDQIAQIDLSQGKIVYLSDLKPESVAYEPYFSLDKELPARLEFFRVRQDQNLESKPLRVGGARFAKGLAMHSRSEAVYYLPGRFHHFEAIVGIDDELRPRGSVRLVIHGDDKVLYDAVLTGADKEPSRQLDLDVTGVRRLTVLADFTGELNVSGQIVLGDARVSK